jgi:D-xylose 1-dehydrogenase (NADP+, D-xylono-1,5-lactone-forming)
MARVLNWGILSTARISKAVIPPIKASKRSKLVAVGSRTLETGQKFAKNWDIPRVYGSYEELLADPDIDVIYNPLPNTLHAEWTIKAAQAGKHVLCEKPITLTVEELDQVKKAATENNVIVTEAFMYRHHPMTLKVQQLVAEKAIGDIKLLRGCFSFSLGRDEDIRWELDLGGGSLWDVGCYPVSYTLALVGQEPVEMQGFTVKAESGVPKLYIGQMRFANGIHAQFDCSFETPTYMYMEIRGTEGTIIVPDAFKPTHKSHLIIKKEDEENRIDFNYKMLYMGEIEDMENAVLDSKPPRLSLDESRRIISTLVNLHKVGK